jgi:hypothetical protein
MPGPPTEREALVWIRDAMDAGRYELSYHYSAERRDLRAIDVQDVHAAVKSAARIESYDGTPRRGGTCWRVFGPDVDEVRTIAIGFEAFLDKRRRRVVIVTVMEIA